MEDQRSFAARLSAAMKTRDLTITETAARVGIEYPSLAKIVRGQTSPSRPVRKLLLVIFPELADAAEPSLSAK